MRPLACVADENFQTRLERILKDAKVHPNVEVGRRVKNDAPVILPSVLGRRVTDSSGTIDFEATFVYELYLTLRPVRTNSAQAHKLEKDGWKPADTISVSGWAVRFQRDTVIPNVCPESAELDDLQCEEGVLKFFRRHSIPDR